MSPQLKLSSRQIIAFQEQILDWYAAHQRDLPWRKTRDSYRILLSEIMLQQTQVSRVIPKYEAWLEGFPTVQELAAASVSDVLKYWSGLGYNRRALNLKKTAQIITEKYNGIFPQTEKELLELPGIGQYTARAVLCFAFDQQVSVVDVNVKKVILVEILKKAAETDEPQGKKSLLKVQNAALVLHDAQMKPVITDKEIAAIADQLLPSGRAYDWNQALMDYASMMLKQHKIPIPKQSKFKDSRRYYRGQVLKYLLERKKVTLDELTVVLQKEKKWVDELVTELENEGFIIYKKNIIRLSE